MTTLSVRRTSDLDADKARWNIRGIAGTAAAGAVTNVDWAFPEERWISGGELLLGEQAAADTFTCRVVDKDNVLGYGAGVVVDEFATNVPVVTDRQAQGLFECPYVALVPAGLYFRIAYTSTGGTAVSVRARLLTHIPRA